MFFDQRTSISVSTALLLGCVAAHGETPNALVKQALERNPELNFYVAAIAAAKGGLRTAATNRNPELESHAGYKNSRDNSGGPSGDGPTWSVSLAQTFEYPGRIALRKAIANHDVALAELHLQEFRLKLAARVRSLAYVLINAYEKTTAAREIAARFQALSDVLAQRPLAGVTPQLEAQIINANLLIFQRQERESKLAEKTITAELNQLCGRSAIAPLSVNAGTVSFSPLSLTTLLNAARSNAFDIRIRQVELAQHGFKIALSKNERYPAVAIGPFYSFEKAADTEQQIGLGVSLPLPLWDRNAGNIATSTARQQQAQAALLTSEREVDRRVTQNAAVLETKRAELDAWKSDAIAKLRETSEVADRNYRLGAVSLTIYVETQKQYLEAINAVSDIQKDALEAAQELEVLTGIRLYKGESP